MVAGTGTVESMPMDSTNAVIVLVANDRRMVLLPGEATSSYHDSNRMHRRECDLTHQQLRMRTVTSSIHDRSCTLKVVYM